MFKNCQGRGGEGNIALDVSHGGDGTNCVAEGEKRLPAMV